MHDDEKGNPDGDKINEQIDILHTLPTQGLSEQVNEGHDIGVPFLPLEGRLYGDSEGALGECCGQQTPQVSAPDSARKFDPLSARERRISTGASSLPSREDAFSFPPSTAGQGREEIGNCIMRRAEGALARTKLPVWEWSRALFDAKENIVAANKEFGSGPAQLLKDKKPMLADLARRIKQVEKQIEKQILQDNVRYQELLEAGNYAAFISLMEHGWWLREELYGGGSTEVQEHVEELALMLNNVAMHLVKVMTPEGNDEHAKLAYAYLNRAEMLTASGSNAVSDEARKRIRAVTFNNLGCYYERRDKLLKSLQFLDSALHLELDAKLVEDPSVTHLNLCRLLSRLERHEAAFEHVRCAIDILEDRMLSLNKACEVEKARQLPSAPPTPCFDGATTLSTSAGAEVEAKRWSLRDREGTLEERLKDSVGKFAIASHSAACELERLHRFADALEFHRKAAEGARQAFGFDDHLSVKFQEDLNACSKISHRVHSKKTAPASPPPHHGNVEGRISYGCGVVAGPTTIVAGTRAGVNFGFETTTKRAFVPSSSSRISLGKYGAEELRAMFADTSKFDKRRAQSSTVNTTNMTTSRILDDATDQLVSRVNALNSNESDSAALLQELVASFGIQNISHEVGHVQADMDGDGKVSEADFIHFIAGLHLKCPESGARALFKFLDTHEEGRIRKDAWMDALKRAESSSHRLGQSCVIQSDSSHSNSENDLLSIIAENLSKKERRISDATDGVLNSQLHFIDLSPITHPRQKRNLEPIALKGDDEIEGFWIDKRDNVAYHLSKIGPVSQNLPLGLDYLQASCTQTRTGQLTQTTNLLQTGSHLGELPPMDPRRELEPERMDHLENVAKFLYQKVGPLPEVMIRLKLRVFDALAWKAWRQEHRDRAWAEAKTMIRKTAETAENNFDSEAQHVDFSSAPNCRQQWDHSRMLVVPLGIHFEELKTTIAAELGLDVSSVELMAKDQEDEDYFNVASEQGLRSIFAACPGLHKSCEFFCTGEASSYVRRVGHTNIWKEEAPTQTDFQQASQRLP